MVNQIANVQEKMDEQSNRGAWTLVKHQTMSHVWRDKMPLSDRVSHVTAVTAGIELELTVASDRKSRSIITKGNIESCSLERPALHYRHGKQAP